MLRALILPVLMLATPVAAVTTIQQDFDAAQALLDAGKAAEARTAFTALLTRFSPASRGKAASVVRARLGNVMRLMGDPEAAEPLLAAAVGGLTGAAPQDSNERASALLDLALTQENLINFDAAAKSYRTLLVEPGFIDVFANEYTVRAGLVRTLMWTDPDEARRQADLLLAAPREKFGKTSEPRALLESLRGRIEINAGNPAEAKRWFTAAARSAGGADTTRVSIGDVRIRGDLALANFQLGNMSEVQKFAALSGAGQLVNEGLGLASRTPLPGCAPLTGLATDAVAVVEFNIASDGRAVGVTPIYASGGTGTVASAIDRPELLFAQAVRDWFWAPDRLAKLDPFWRQAVRVELRCFNDRPESDPVTRSFYAEGLAWYEKLGVRDLPDLPDNDAAALPLIQAEISRRETADGAQSPQLLPALVALSSNLAASDTERRAAIARWRGLTRQHEPPLPVRIDLRLTEINWISPDAKSYAEVLQSKFKQQSALLDELETSGQGESRPAMLVRLRLGETLTDMRSAAKAGALFTRITASPETVLPAADPIRISALLRISNMAAAARDMATAANALAATGLTPEQCSLVDIRPEGINNSISSSAFPTEARRWSNNGLVKVGFDITADGRTTNIRTIVAAPPFIYDAATEKAIAKFRYRPVFRPGNTLGCTGTVIPVRFRML